MIRLRISEETLNVLISKEEKLDLNKAKDLIRKGRRMILQSSAESLIIELKNANRINPPAMNLFRRMVRCSEDFPIKIISN